MYDTHLFNLPEHQENLIRNVVRKRMDEIVLMLPYASLKESSPFASVL
ncbi:MAG: hypothetical protein QOD67_2461 [Caballeronia sp.]|jgi:hypothetical protein|nr:hypothetical protein [Caballeronia sp.]